MSEVPFPRPAGPALPGSCPLQAFAHASLPAPAALSYLWGFGDVAVPDPGAPVIELPAFVQPVLDFIRAHEAWAVPIVFLLAFGESLAFISLLLPATVILWGIGA